MRRKVKGAIIMLPDQSVTSLLFAKYMGEHFKCSSAFLVLVMNKTAVK